MSDEEPPGADVVRAALAREDAVPGDQRQEATRRAAAVIRELTAELITSDPGLPTLLDVIADLRRARDALSAAPRRPPSWMDHTSDGRSSMFFEVSPIAGRSNPLAPPMIFHMEGDAVIGTVTYGPACEGPPGSVHGGLLAAGFDEVLGIAQSLSGQFGMTGKLEIRYRRPSPLGMPLRFEGRVGRVEGRKLHIVGRVLADGAVTAEAHGLFIAIGHEGFASMREYHRAQATRQAAGDATTEGSADE